MEPSADRISAKLHTLSNAQLAQVERFVESLQAEDSDRELTRAWARASEPSFQAVWSNPEDAIYDHL